MLHIGKTKVTNDLVDYHSCDPAVVLTNSPCSSKLVQINPEKLQSTAQGSLLVSVVQVSFYGFFLFTFSMAPQETIKLINIVHAHTHICVLHRAKHKESNQNIVVKNEFRNIQKRSSAEVVCTTSSISGWENHLCSFTVCRAFDYTEPQFMDLSRVHAVSPQPADTQRCYAGHPQSHQHDDFQLLHLWTFRLQRPLLECQVCVNKRFCVTLGWTGACSVFMEVSECSSVGG